MAAKVIHFFQSGQVMTGRVDHPHIHWAPKTIRAPTQGIWTDWGRSELLPTDVQYLCRPSAKKSTGLVALIGGRRAIILDRTWAGVSARSNIYLSLVSK